MAVYRLLGMMGIAVVIIGTAMFWPGEPESGLPAPIVLGSVEPLAPSPPPSTPPGLTVVRPAPIDLDDLGEDDEDDVEPPVDDTTPATRATSSDDRDSVPDGSSPDDEDDRDDDEDDGDDD